jgi:hypothetical protein
MFVACPFHCPFDGPFSFDPKDLPNFAPLPEKQAVEIRATEQRSAQRSAFQTTVILFNRACSLPVRSVSLGIFKKDGSWACEGTFPLLFSSSNVV